MKFSPELLSPGVEKKKKIAEEKMSKEPLFVQKEGVAHIGPDFKNISHDIADIVSIEDINKKEEDLKIKSREGKRFKNKTGDLYPNFLSKVKNYIANMPTAWIQDKKGMRMMAKKNPSKDNLKTMSESKKERNKRGETREVLHDPKSWEESGKKLDPIDSIEE